MATFSSNNFGVVSWFIQVILNFLVLENYMKQGRQSDRNHLLE